MEIMEALSFFGITFGILFFVASIVAIFAFKSEKQKTTKIHDEFLKQFD